MKFAPLSRIALTLVATFSFANFAAAEENMTCDQAGQIIYDELVAVDQVAGDLFVCVLTKENCDAEVSNFAKKGFTQEDFNTVLDLAKKYYDCKVAEDQG